MDLSHTLPPHPPGPVPPPPANTPPPPAPPSPSRPPSRTTTGWKIFAGIATAAAAVAAAFTATVSAFALLITDPGCYEVCEQVEGLIHIGMGFGYLSVPMVLLGSLLAFLSRRRWVRWVGIVSMFVLTPLAWVFFMLASDMMNTI